MPLSDATTSRRRSGRAGDAVDPSFPGTILPSQYFDRIRARASDMPEKRLMIAVLFDSIAHLQRRGSVGALEAERWIRGEDDADDAPFSFRNICETLGIDAQYLARGLLEWHRTTPALRTLPFRQPRICRPRIRQMRRRRRVALGSTSPR